MRNQVLSMLIILMVCLSLSSCCSLCKKDSGKIGAEIFHKYVECPAPDKPTFKQMSTVNHIGGMKNLNILTDNLYKTMEYNERLINTLNCYKSQSESKVIDEDKK